MALTDQIAELLRAAVEANGAYLEDVHLATPGKHRIVTVIVDGDSALNLDQVTVITKAISELLDNATFMGETPFTLEVTSPGIDRPLTLPRHFAKNVSRLLKVTNNDGSVVEGRLKTVGESEITLEIAIKKETTEKVIALSDIKRAVVEIEFNRKGDL